MKTAVLIDERDRRVGKTQVPESCFVIRHSNATFIRTGKAVRLRPSTNAMAVVFEQCDVYIRERLESI